MSTLSRRRLMQGAAAAGFATMAAGRYNYAAAQAGPLKIPVLMSLSGPLALVGTNAKLGAEITAKLINDKGGVLGRPIELMFVDDKARPQDAAAAARDAIAQGYTYLSGSILTAVLLAIQPILTETKTVMTSAAGAGVNFTHESFNRYTFPGLDNDALRAVGLAKLSAQKFPDVKHYSSIISESKPYIDSYTNFQHFAKKFYGAKAPKFAEPHIVKIGAGDFRNQIAQLASTDVDAFYNFVIGTDGITLWQQARAFGLANKFKAVIDQTLDFASLKALKKNLPNNLWTQVGWWHAVHQDVELSREFYKAYVAQTGDAYPSGYMHYGCMCVIPLVEAIKASGGKTDAESIITALERIKFTTLKGEHYFRKEDHMLLGTNDFCKIEGTDEDPGIKVVDALKISTVDLAPPPNPGKPFVLPA
jgi:branched-chain amino acid transport system substrate-binding protein